jgi:hypothetical protein
MMVAKMMMLDEEKDTILWMNKSEHDNLSSGRTSQ